MQNVHLDAHLDGKYHPDGIQTRVMTRIWTFSVASGPDPQNTLKMVEITRQNTEIASSTGENGPVKAVKSCDTERIQLCAHVNTFQHH